MKSTRRRFCFVALRTNLKDIKPTEKNYILKPNELRNHSPVSRWIDLCRYFSLCVHKDKACLSVLETRFINSRCMKLKHIKCCQCDYSTVVFKNEKISMQHKIGAKILPSVKTAHSLSKHFAFHTKENLSISFNYIRVASVTHVPTSLNVLFGLIIMWI